MKPTYLVTGATGFIGANLVHALVHNKQTVAILSRHPRTSWRTRDIIRNCSVYACDLLDRSKLTRALARIRPTYILHCAVYGSYPSETDVTRMFQTNIIGTQNLLTAAFQTGCKAFINTGTSSEYGLKDKPMKETDLTVPVNDYGIVKAAQTMMCTKFALRNRLPLVTLRLFSVFGPYEDPNRLMPSVIVKALLNHPISVSSPSYVRDFIYARDVAQAFTTACTKATPAGEVVNIGSGRQRTLREVVTTIRKLTNTKSIIHWGTVPKQSRQIEPRQWRAHVGKAKNMLQWRPQYTFINALSQTCQWYRDNISFYT